MEGHADSSRTVGASMQAPRVFAVIVTYRPDHAALNRLIGRLSPQVSGIVIADNSSDAETAETLQRAAGNEGEYVSMGDNRGVAEGLNRGASHACARGATHLLLMDQDSDPPDDMVQLLLHALDSLQAQEVRVAAVGPRYVDPRSGYVAPFVRTQGLRLAMVDSDQDESVEVDFVITSGALVPVASWAAIGPMAGPMFIDYVDIEWGLRARAVGYRSFGVHAARMGHSLGDRRMAFLGQSVPIHSPLRHYYQIRNPLWLYRQSWIPMHWKLVDGFRLLLRFVFNAVFVAPRLENFRCMLRGLIHGLAGRLGRYDTLP